MATFALSNGMVTKAEYDAMLRNDMEYVKAFKLMNLNANKKSTGIQSGITVDIYAGRANEIYAHFGLTGELPLNK